MLCRQKAGLGGGGSERLFVGRGVGGEKSKYPGTAGGPKWRRSIVNRIRWTKGEKTGAQEKGGVP